MDQYNAGSVDRWIGRSLEHWIVSLGGPVDWWISRSVDRQISGSVD